MTSAGFNRFSGMHSNHVKKIQFPGSGKATDYHARMHKSSERVPNKSENSAGQDPQAYSHPQISQKVFTR
jgi:hypothetical protein